MCSSKFERRAMETSLIRPSVSDRHDYTLVEYQGRPLEAQIVQPPLPDGNDSSTVELSGTKHWRSMALDTLRSEESHHVPDEGRKSILQPCSLTTEGIEFAQPASIYRFLNRGPYKVSSLSKTWDDLGRPRPWIPAHVHRTFHNLTTDDIKGARPNPKNMKLGNAARGTNPLDPAYKLPSCKVSPPSEPKFLRDNLIVDDISGSRSQHRVRFVADSAASKEVIEGSFPGWRPTHRRRFGKSVRDLCLQVQDINRPARRMVRSGNAQAYLEIEGTHPKHLKQFQTGEVRSNHSLQAFDIQGTEAGSRPWMYNVQRRKEEGKERTCFLKQQESQDLLAREILDSKAQGLQRELKGIFKQLDRDNSGKLTAEEVDTALRRLQVDVNAMELKSLTSAFNTDMDGFVDYQKLILAMSPVEQKKHFNREKLDSRVVALCLNQWIDRPWPDAIIKPDSSIKLKQKRDNRVTNLDCRITKNGKSVNFLSEKTSPLHSRVQMPMESKEERSSIFVDRMDSNDVLPGKELPSKSFKFPPLQLGLPFWPDEKMLHAQGIPREYFSLPQDYKDEFRELPKNPIKPLSDEEKAWQKNVGDTLFTGEGNVVGLGSYMTGYDWSRQMPQTARLPAKKRRLWRCQSLPSFFCLPEFEGGMSTARSENVMMPKASSRNKDHKGPATPCAMLNARRPMSASYAQAGKAGQFCSPRSVLISPMSSRSSGSPRSGILSFESTPRIRELFGGSISARESLASRNQAERQCQRLQTTRREDAAAVRSLC